MKTREQLYSREAASILRDITTYRVLSEEQILLLQNCKTEKTRQKLRGLLTYLVRQGRVWLCEGLYCAGPDELKMQDRELYKAVWVLGDFADRVEYHSAGDYPSAIVFFADDEVYEVICAPRGKEALLSCLLGRLKKPSRYLVLVDDPAQIELLQLPNVSAYCTVSPDGEVQYYKTEQEVNQN